MPNVRWYFSKIQINAILHIIWYNIWRTEMQYTHKS
jgi:hypothetical protein